MRHPNVPSTRPAAASSLMRRLTAEAPLPSQVVPVLPRWLDELVRACLADQHQRFENVELELLEAS